jgi:hypothetical protein
MGMRVMNERHNPTEKALAFIFIVGDAVGSYLNIMG